MNPFEGMEISDNWQTLFNINERQPCRKCSKSRKYFCYTCYTLNADIENKIPMVKLPFKIDIIKHSREIAGKSTAIHAALLAPNDVTIYIYPDMPKYTEDDKNNGHQNVQNHNELCPIVLVCHQWFTILNVFIDLFIHHIDLISWVFNPWLEL
ncbi:PREDICTED: DTW domain-containing protein 1-like [Diuraphis noxia]|uniref:DTW domain-containing protein 1-like n=1 Tax=Diuraphis noxia TaxID=143948 RepID=UPI0007636043|nr:PREDICTED: DTW domain-containing protein 1-like [Diuraphis noxia]